MLIMSRSASFVIMTLYSFKLILVYTYEETLQKGLFSRVYNFQTPGNILIYRLRRYMR